MQWRMVNGFSEIFVWLISRHLSKANRTARAHSIWMAMLVVLLTVTNFYFGFRSFLKARIDSFFSLLFAGSPCILHSVSPHAFIVRWINVNFDSLVHVLAPFFMFQCSIIYVVCSVRVYFTAGMYYFAFGASLFSAEQLRLDAVRRILSAHRIGISIHIGASFGEVVNGIWMDCARIYINIIWDISCDSWNRMAKYAVSNKKQWKCFTFNWPLNYNRRCNGASFDSN